MSPATEELLFSVLGELIGMALLVSIGILMIKNDQEEEERRRGAKTDRGQARR